MKSTTRLQATGQTATILNSELESYRKELAARTVIAQNTLRQSEREIVKDNFVSSKIETYKQIESGVGSDTTSLNNPNVRFSVKNFAIVSSLSNPNKFVRTSSYIARSDSRFEQLELSNNHRGVILDAKI